MKNLKLFGFRMIGFWWRLEKPVKFDFIICFPLIKLILIKDFSIIFRERL
jgi:hypothetical protein